MSTETLSLCAFAEPDFGDLGELWQRADEYLQREGFGVLVDDAASGCACDRALAGADQRCPGLTSITIMCSGA
jgi:hypothetical protein